MSLLRQFSQLLYVIFKYIKYELKKLFQNEERFPILAVDFSNPLLCIVGLFHAQQLQWPRTMLRLNEYLLLLWRLGSIHRYNILSRTGL